MEVKLGTAVSVDWSHAGEGTGLKSMKDVEWREGEEVRVKVSGQKEGEHWVCSCHYLLRGQQHLMARFRRAGPRPLNRKGFYSFVEDWDRCSGASGHLACREAQFRDQRLTMEECQLGHFTRILSIVKLPQLKLRVNIVGMKCQVYDCRDQKST